MGLPEAAMRNIRSSKISLIFQEPATSLNPVMTVGDQIVETILLHTPLRGDEARAKALDWLKKVGIPEPERRMKSFPFELSGGEKRRVAIAGVIAMDPDVLILDEPTAGLDPRGRDVLLSQIVNYHEVRHNTILLVSHSMEDIARTADRILVMNGGKAAMFDETKKVFARGEELERMGLRVPQITKILAMLQKDGYPVETALTLEQAIRQLMPLLEEGGRTHG